MAYELGRLIGALFGLGLTLLILFVVAYIVVKRPRISFSKGRRRRRQNEWIRFKNHWAEPGATANEHACHGSCSEQHAPRQARSSLSLNVRQK